MLESGWYAPGTEFDPRAPWNEVEIPEREFDATISSSLSKSTTIESKNYIIEEDPDGSYIDTSEIRWLEEYSEQHYTPIQLIEMYKKELEEKKKFLSNPYQIKQIEKIIAECEGWVEDEIEVFEDKL